jgi:hypothetical protein
MGLTIACQRKVKLLWRKGLGTTYVQNDYNVWRANFGRTAGAGSGASATAAVPEPKALVLLRFADASGRFLRSRFAQRVPSTLRHVTEIN